MHTGFLSTFWSLTSCCYLHKWIAVINSPKTDTRRFYAMFILISTFHFCRFKPCWHLDSWQKKLPLSVEDSSICAMMSNPMQCSLIMPDWTTLRIRWRSEHVAVPMMSTECSPLIGNYKFINIPGHCPLHSKPHWLTFMEITVHSKEQQIDNSAR